MENFWSCNITKVSFLSLQTSQYLLKIHELLASFRILRVGQLGISLITFKQVLEQAIALYFLEQEGP